MAVSPLRDHCCGTAGSLGTRTLIQQIEVEVEALSVGKDSGWDTAEVGKREEKGYVWGWGGGIGGDDTDFACETHLSSGTSVSAQLRDDYSR